MKKFAPILILIAGVLWGSMGLFVRTLNAQGLASMEIVGLRATVTVVALFLFLLLYFLLCLAFLLLLYNLYFALILLLYMF